MNLIHWGNHVEEIPDISFHKKTIVVAVFL